MVKVGSRVTVEIDSTDETLTLTLDDRVLHDPTCGQWEDGWYVYDINDITDKEYFISDAGIVYGDDPEKPHDNLSRFVGTVKAWQ
jgi:hypothetical protein